MDYKIKLKNIDESCCLIKTPKDARAFIASKLVNNFNNSDFVFIAKNDAEMLQIQKQLQYFFPELPILNFYAWDCLPYDRTSPKPAILNSRIKTLYNLANKKEDQSCFVITSINAISQKCINPNNIKHLGLFLEVGAKASIDDITRFLVNKGYNRQTCANDVSEFAVRGGIIDIVIAEAADLVGYRIDFFGDEVESIKIFDPITQLSQESVKKIEILPNNEVILEKTTIENFRNNYRNNFGAPNIEDHLYAAISDNRSYIGMEHWLPFFYNNDLVSFFDYLKNPVIFFDSNILEDLEIRNDLIQEYYDARIAEKNIRENGIYNPVNPELLYFSNADFKELINAHTMINFSEFETNQLALRQLNLEFKEVPDFALHGRTTKQDPMNLMKDFAIKTRSQEEKIKISIALLSTSFEERFKKLMHDYEINFPTAILPLNKGFYNNDLMIIGEQAIFGEKIIRKKSKKIASQRLIEESLTINKDELIVHRDFGIGKFCGIEIIEASGIKVDMIKLLYGNNDTLFIPVDDINLITRYGSDNPLIQLDRLGVAAWKNRREKVKKKIKIAAEELLKIAAARQLRKSPIFYANQDFYEEFKNRFAYAETEDQLQAIEEVEEDLQKGMPMDRLICGDVGFGKTEVAMRAAALVVGEKNKKQQVAIVAPTTLLVRQHYKNFIERFKGLDVNIKQLSRLITTTKAKEIKQELQEGKIDIIIGTHALLQKTIKFKDLALLIIDEEQHFGVAQKERIKELKNEVHILTLSATPIPRTLQMSLTGVKDLSLIATPPIDRLAVRNFVMPYDSVITKEAIIREYNRGGRVFFVVPRVRDIEEMEPRLKILLPDLKIQHAHGQMTPNELDKIMNDFVDGKIDVLLSTTIIESGIDISEANTMIIYKADMFGLAQLYQLRGRVGRTKVRGYCYFMTNNRKNISRDAKKKLEVMQNLDSLGVGFSVASHDMDIRGSGNILGGEQSGHVKETGVELYQQMLLEVIQKEKNKQSNLNNQKPNFDTDFTTQIKLGISLLIPKEYIEDLPLRMSFYKKIASIKNNDEQDAMIEEMSDRFGKVPEEINNLIEISKLKHQCKEVNIEKLEATKQGILIAFKDNNFSNPEALMKLIFANKNRIKVQSNQKILFSKITESDEDKIRSAFEVSRELLELV